ncbi:MAG: thioredoxin [Candidatus Omnitrophica bacterium]|nr:thioredoxin [Candidatus Omnitrophota bacterium]MDD5573797.1 thioredoxin [Candidatus Omnitrophota bacterium]
MGAVHLSDENFKKEVLESKTPCLVDFWAEWCGPCRRVAPVVEEIADEFQGRVKVAKLNVDEGSKTASAYGVMSIPTLMFFKDGKVVEQIVGAVAKQELAAKIEELLS